MKVARAIADGVAAGRAEVYTRPDGLERVLQHLRGLSGAAGPKPG